MDENSFTENHQNPYRKDQIDPSLRVGLSRNKEERDLEIKNRLAVKSYEEGPWVELLSLRKIHSKRKKKGHLEKEDGNNLPADFWKQLHVKILKEKTCPCIRERDRGRLPVSTSSCYDPSKERGSCKI